MPKRKIHCKISSYERFKKLTYKEYDEKIMKIGQNICVQFQLQLLASIVKQIKSVLMSLLAYLLEKYIPK